MHKIQDGFWTYYHWSLGFTWQIFRWFEINFNYNLSLKALPIFVSDVIFAFFGQQCRFFNKIVHDLIWWTERTKHHSIRSRLFFYAAVKKSPNLLILWIVFHTIFVIWYPRWPKCIPWKFLLNIFYSKRVKLKSCKSFFANVTLSKISRQMLLMLVCKSTK